MVRFSEKVRSGLILLIVYTIAFTLSWYVSRVSNYPPLLQSAVMVALAVTVIFLGSVDFRNSSVFDPYWSVAPPVMAVYYWLGADGYLLLTMSNFLDVRIVAVFLLALLYGIRLTWNFLGGWSGMTHEDWRYRDLRKKSGKWYWLVSFLGIHFFPALMVFGGTLSIWVVASFRTEPVGFIDMAAFLVTLGAIILEAVSDRQLKTFIRQENASGRSCDKGLWGYSRHPNYLGEILFWWGLYLFALAASPQYWWVVVGPGAITLMFIFISIPMMEKRQRERRTDYQEYSKRVPVLIPRIRF